MPRLQDIGTPFTHALPVRWYGLPVRRSFSSARLRVSDPPCLAKFLQQPPSRNVDCSCIMGESEVA